MPRPKKGGKLSKLEKMKKKSMTIIIMQKSGTRRFAEVFGGQYTQSC